MLVIAQQGIIMHSSQMVISCMVIAQVHGNASYTVTPNE
jgi:hypothetical protein